MKKLLLVVVILISSQAKAELYNGALVTSMQLQAQSHSPAAVYPVPACRYYYPAYSYPAYPAYPAYVYGPAYEPVYWPPIAVGFGYSSWGWGGYHHGGHGGYHHGGHSGGYHGGGHGGGGSHGGHH